MFSANCENKLLRAKIAMISEQIQESETSVRVRMNFDFTP